MQAWRRLIAILMIVLFAPNTVVAAGPLNLCLGSDGHRVIEPLLEMHHHKGHTEAGESNRASKGAADSEVVTAGPSGCCDILFDTSDLAMPRDGLAVAKQCAPSNAFFILVPHALSVARASFLRGLDVKCRKYDLLATDPRLVDLATVVLLN